VSPFATDSLVLIGTDDTWTPADRCLKSVVARAHQARPLAIKVYPGAVHGFDLGPLPALHSFGHMVGGNPEAAADSFKMTKDFLDARLKAKVPDEPSTGRDQDRLAASAAALAPGGLRPPPPGGWRSWPGTW
jgi:hypothetical protein